MVILIQNVFPLVNARDGDVWGYKNVLGSKLDRIIRCTTFHILPLIGQRQVCFIKLRGLIRISTTQFGRWLLLVGLWYEHLLFWSSSALFSIYWRLILLYRKRQGCWTIDLVLHRLFPLEDRLTLPLGSRFASFRFWGLLLRSLLLLLDLNQILSSFLHLYLSFRFSISNFVV